MGPGDDSLEELDLLDRIMGSVRISEKTFIMLSLRVRAGKGL